MGIGFCPFGGDCFSGKVHSLMSYEWDFRMWPWSRQEWILCLWIGYSNNMFSVIWPMGSLCFYPQYWTWIFWRNLSPPKIEIFMWLACQNRIATRSVLNSRNIIVGMDEQDLACKFCLPEVETPEHVLLICPFSRQIWSKMQSGGI